MTDDELRGWQQQWQQTDDDLGLVHARARRDDRPRGDAPGHARAERPTAQRGDRPHRADHDGKRPSSHKGSHSHGGQTRDGQRSGGGERRGNGQRPVRRQARPQG